MSARAHVAGTRGASAWLRRRAAIIAVAAPVALGGTLALVQWLALLRALRDARPPQVDFPAFWSAARLVADGRGDELFDIEAVGAIEAGIETGVLYTQAYLNPPFFAGLLAPLGTLSYIDAYLVWTAFNGALFALSLALLWRLTSGAPRHTRRWLLVATAGFALVPFAIQLGQFSMLLLVSWAATALALRSGRERLAGLALAPTLVKPELLIPVALALLLARRYRSIATLGACTIVAIAASLAVAGVASLWEYPAFVASDAATDAHGTILPWMMGWNGLLGAALRPESPGLLTLLTLPLSTATVAFAVRPWRAGPPADQADLARRWALLTVATVLADPHIYPQDLVILLPAAWWLLATARGAERRAAIRMSFALWAACAAPFLWTALHVNLVAILLAVALVWLARATRRPAARAAAPAAEPARAAA